MKSKVFLNKPNQTQQQQQQQLPNRYPLSLSSKKLFHKNSSNNNNNNNNRMTMISWWCIQSFLLFSSILLSLSSSCQAQDEKRLVFFAGPHHAASSSVEQFFYHYAAKHKKKQKETFGLRKWEWPHFNETLVNEALSGIDSTENENNENNNENNNHHHSIPGYSMLEYLVTEPTNEKLQKVLMDGIQQTWDDAWEGMILGTPELDRAAGGHVQGLLAMQRVVEILNVASDQVTVILNYRTPRIDQWITTWLRHHDATTENVTYQEYMCNPNLFHLQEEIMATAMNPMELAQTFLEQDWQVVLMDLAGIEAAGRDVATVIACDVLHGVCDDGYLRNHEEHPYHENEELIVAAAALPHEGDVDMAEEILLSRDCYYEPYIREQVTVVHNVSVWNKCSPYMRRVYAQLNDSAIVFRALLSQMECEELPERMVTIDQVLKGEVPQSEQEWIDLETAGDLNLPGVAGSNGGGGSRFVEVIMFPLILLSAGGYQMYRMHKSRVNQSNQKQSAIREAEMSEMGTSSSSPLPPSNNGHGGFRDEVTDPSSIVEEEGSFQ